MRSAPALLACALVASSCELDVPAFGTPCDDDADCNAGYLCDALGFCVDESIAVPAVAADAGDGADLDAGTLDGGKLDAGAVDAGKLDAGNADGGRLDAGSSDAGSLDAGGTLDSGVDAGGVDAGGVDAGSVDAGTDDAGEVPPPEPGRIELRLSWPSGGGDASISATKRQLDGRFCIDNYTAHTGATVGPLTEECGAMVDFDCNYIDCQDGATNRTDWDGVPDVTDGDPTFIVDALNGGVPELIIVPVLVDGEYVLSVSYFESSSITTTAIAEVFVDGRTTPAFSASLPLTKDADWFDVAKLVKSPGGLCIEDLTDGALTDECG